MRGIGSEQHFVEGTSDKFYRRGIGSEQHFVEGTSDKFYRMVQAGSQVLVRWGRRGTYGQVQIKKLSSAYEAQGFFYEQFQAKENKGYVLAYRDVFMFGGLEVKDIKVIEQQFLEQWLTVLSPMFDGNEIGGWMMVYGLIGISDKSPLLKGLYARLLDCPHALDVAGDRILARVPHWYAFGERSSLAPDLPGMQDIGEAQGDETEQEMRQVLSLHYPTHPNPCGLFSTVRRLTKAT